MKKILLLILLVFSTSLIFAQVEDIPLFSGRVFMSQVGSGAGYWEISGTFQDQSGYFDASSIAVGQIVFFTDAGIGYHLPITTVVSATDPSFIVRINNTGISTILSVPTGEGVIYETTNNNLVPFVSGITDPNQQTLIQYNLEKVNDALNIEQEMILSGTNIQLSDNAGVPGNAGSIGLSGIRGITVTNNAGNINIALPTATTGQVLKYNGTNWIPDTDAGGATDLAITNRINTTLDITSSTGADITVPQATTTLSGLMSGTDKTKLDSDNDQSSTNEVLTITDGTNTEALGGQTLGIYGGGMISSIYTPGTNSLVISANEGDADPQNEGSLFLTAEAANTTGINSNTLSSAKIIISGSLNQSVTENVGTNTITLTNTLADGTVYIGNITNVAQSRTLSGDASVTNTGVVTVDKIDNTPVTATGASTGQVLKWDGSAWIPSADNTGGAGSTDLSISNITATTLDVVSSSGIDATVPAATSTLAGVMPAADKVKSDFTTITQAVDLDALEAASHAAVTVTDNARIDLTLTGQNIQADLLQNGATTGQVYKWNGTNWAPANDLGTTYTGGTGIDVTGTVITNTGDLLNNNEGSLSVLAGTGSTSIIQSNTTGSTDLTINAGTGIAISENTGTNNITITNGSPDQTVVITGAGTASVTGTYPNFTVTGTGISSTLNNNNILIGNASNVATAVNPSGDADISNTGVIAVDKIDGVNVTATGATADQLWRWDTGTSTWIPSDERTQQLILTGTTDPQIELSDNSGLSGGAGAMLVVGQRGMVITNSGGDIHVALPTGTTGQILRSNGTTWSAQNESLQGMRVNPTSGLNPTLQLSANDGTYTVPSGSMQMTATTPMTISATGSSSINVELSQAGATTGQVLKWNGSNWIPDNDATGGAGTSNLTFSGASSPVTLQSDTGTDVIFTAGTNTTFSQTGNNLTINATTQQAYNTIKEETTSLPQQNTLAFVSTALTASNGGSQTNITVDSDIEALGANATTGLYTITAVGGPSTGVGRTITAGTGISVSNGNGVAGNPTITNSAPDLTVVLNDGTGIDVTGTYPTFTVNATKVLREETFTATASQTTFTMIYSAPAVSGTAYPIRVYRNGNELNWVASAPSITQYTYTGTTLTTFANDSGDIIRVNYLN